VNETKAEELLADVRTLRLGVRRDRRASAFPLLLFGALILAAPLCYAPIELRREIWTRYPVRDSGPFPQFFRPDPFRPVEYPGLIGWYWFLTIVGGFVATVWWYRRRAMRIGVETDTGAYLTASGAALAGFLLGVPVLNELVPGHALYSTPTANLPLLFGATVAAGVVLYWCTRSNRTRVQRTAGLFAGVLLAMLSFAAFGVYLRTSGYAALLVIAAGLLALAWLERNALLAAIGLVFGGVALTVNLYHVQNLFARFGWTAELGQAQVVAVQALVLPGLVLVVGGLVIAVTGRRPAR
jgi:hypothetical protein